MLSVKPYATLNAEWMKTTKMNDMKQALMDAYGLTEQSSNVKEISPTESCAPTPVLGGGVKEVTFCQTYLIYPNGVIWPKRGPWQLGGTKQFKKKTVNKGKVKKVKQVTISKDEVY